MLATVIDANVFHAFFYETFQGKPHGERTGSAIPLFSSLGSKSVAFVDDGCIIESEWRGVCKGAEEWFGAWLAEALLCGWLYEIEPSSDKGLPKRYNSAGLPKGRDICYVRVAHGLTQVCKRTRPWIVAEDVDFFDPTRKASGRKAEILKTGKGPIAGLLRTDGIEVACIESFTSILTAH